LPSFIERIQNNDVATKGFYVWPNPDKPEKNRGEFNAKHAEIAEKN